MMLPAHPGQTPGLTRSAWLERGSRPVGRHLQTRPIRRSPRAAWLVGLAAVVLVGGGGVLLAGRLGLTGMTGGQALELAHKAVGVVVLLHAAGVLMVLLGQSPGRVWAWLRQVSALSMAAGAWVAVGLGTFSGYPRYAATPQAGGSPAPPRAWLLAHHPGWDILMTVKVLVGFLAPFVLTAVAVAVIRHPALLARDAALRRLIRILLAVGVAAATLAATIAVGVDTVTPQEGLG